MEQRGFDSKIHIGRIGEPEDVVSVVNFLIYNSRFIKIGGEIILDGGITLSSSI